VSDAKEKAERLAFFDGCWKVRCPCGACRCDSIGGSPGASLRQPCGCGGHGKDGGADAVGNPDGQHGEEVA